MDATDNHPENASIFGVRPGAKAIVHRFGFSPAESGNAIVALHAAEYGVISSIAETASGKVTILHLRFLQTQHVGFVRRQPV
jgi:hypothetical protein